MRINQKLGIYRSILATILLGIFFTGNIASIYSQVELNSNNYTIVDSTNSVSGGASDSTNYSLSETTGISYADARLESGSYGLGTGFPNDGVIASVPVIKCAETNTNAGNSTCDNLPNGAGAQSECASPGCYDRAKIEISFESNPYDALYLVRVRDTEDNITYYVQSDLSLDTTYDINDYLTICEFEGFDANNPGCDDSGDGSYDATLHPYNLLNLAPNRTYAVSARVINGDFTETHFGPEVEFTTQIPAITLDIDIGETIDVETSAPHLVDLGFLTPGAVATADDLIWLDLNTNIPNGFSAYVRDANQALVSTAASIPSEAEDLFTDPNANGGYGFKTASFTQTNFGPLQASPNFNTGSTDQVGNLTGTDKLIFFTDTSGSNLGQIAEGRAGVYVKAVSTLTTPAGNYTDTATFTMIGNF